MNGRRSEQSISGGSDGQAKIKIEGSDSHSNDEVRSVANDEKRRLEKMMGQLNETMQVEMKGEIGGEQTLKFRRGEIAEILKKEQGKRSENEMETVINLLNTIDFFKNNSSLTYGEMRDLAQSFTYETAEADKEMLTLGSPIDS